MLLTLFDFLFRISVLGAKVWAWGQTDPKTSKLIITLVQWAVSFAKLRLVSQCVCVGRCGVVGSTLAFVPVVVLRS